MSLPLFFKYKFYFSFPSRSFNLFFVGLFVSSLLLTYHPIVTSDPGDRHDDFYFKNRGCYSVSEQNLYDDDIFGTNWNAIQIHAENQDNWSRLLLHTFFHHPRENNNSTKKSLIKFKNANFM